MDWLSAVEQLRRDGLPGVLVTVIKVRGDAPRDAGAKMLVGAVEPETQVARLNEHARNRDRTVLR